VRTRYDRDELLVGLAIEVYVGVAVRELVCRLCVREMMQHGLLHRELLSKTTVACYHNAIKETFGIRFTSLVKVCV
jgi:hypothetical protein